MLLPYSERHFQRLDRLLQSSYLVEHTLASMHMLVAQGGEGSLVSPGGRGVTGAAGSGSSGPLVRELTRLREGGGVEKRRNRGGGGDGGGGDPDSGGSSGSGSDSDDGDGGDVPVPVSETVDGRVVFNVRIAPPAGVGDSDDGGGGDEDVAMGEASSADPVGVNGHAGVVVQGGGGEEGAEGEGEGEDSAQKRRKKKRKKRSSAGADEPLGLVGQPVVAGAVAVVDGAESGVAAVVGGEGEGEAAQEGSGSGKKSRKKRRRSSPAVVSDDATGSAPAIVGEVVDSAAAVEEQAGVVGVDGEGTGEGEDKKKKKKKRSGKGRRKSAAA